MTEHENTNEVPLSIEAGTLLKNKRESLGMSQKQVADRLRLRVSVIEDIENNRFESQQVATFTRGYLRSYAKFVGLDEKMVLTALEQTADVQPQEQEIEMQSFSRKTKDEKHNSRIMLLTWVIGLVIIGISAAWSGTATFGTCGKSGATGPNQSRRSSRDLLPSYDGTIGFSIHTMDDTIGPSVHLNITGISKGR